MTSYLPLDYKYKMNCKNYSNNRYNYTYFEKNKPTVKTTKNKRKTIVVNPNNNKDIQTKGETTIIEIQKKFMTSIQKLNHSQILKKCKELKIIKKFKNDNNCSDSVILLQNYIIKKKLPRNTLGYYFFNNEIKSLFILNSYKHFPKLISFDKNSLFIYMAYCGNEINYKNIPDNWLQQYNEIKHVFTKLKITSGDILQRNICVLNNVIFIIDFGLNTQFSEKYQISLKKLYKILLSISNKKKYANKL